MNAVRIRFTDRTYDDLVLVRKAWCEKFLSPDSELIPMPEFIATFLCNQAFAFLQLKDCYSVYKNESEDMKNED